MDHFFTKYRKLEDEIDDPCTKFMQVVLLDYEKDIETDFNEEYESLTREEVDQLKWNAVKESEEMYNKREAAFCESQVQKLEKESRKRKRSLSNDAADKPDDGYVAGSGLDEIFDSEDEDSFLEIVEEELYYNQKKKDNKRTRKAQKHRFGYLAHRIQNHIPEVFNARQFIRQAEDTLRLKGAEAVDAMNRARQIFFDPRRVTNDANIKKCVNFAKEENGKDARAFDEQLRDPEGPMFIRELDDF